MINQMKKVYGTIIVIMTIIFSLSAVGIALEVETHRAINGRIADKNYSINGFYLHQYLQNQLGIQNGLEEYFNNKKVFDIIADGGVSEDNFLRYLNHFYNPLNNSGLLGNFPAKDWALRPIGNQYSDGQYSWFDARDYYLKALTSTDKTTRETNFAETFRAIGQVIHLVQDMSVPAHTRHDIFHHQLTSYLEV